MQRGFRCKLVDQTASGDCECTNCATCHRTGFHKQRWHCWISKALYLFCCHFSILIHVTPCVYARLNDTLQINLQMSSFLGPPPSGWTLDIVGVIFGRDFLRRWCRSFCSCFCFWTFNCGCGWWQRQRGGSGEGGRRKSRRRKGHALTNCSRFLPFLVAICFSYLHGKFRCCLKWIAFSTRHHFFCQLWDSMLRRSIVVIIVDHSYAWMVQCELWVGGWMIF